MSGTWSSDQPITGPVRLASRNPGKLREVRAIMAEVGVEVLPAPEEWIPPEETGATYLENALLKARSLMQHTGAPALADDSGIEVDVLDGGPGPRSARFAGEGATDAQNLEKLIRIVRTTPPHERGARYRCVAVLSVPNGYDPHAEGVFEGALIADPRGTNGFGYDPIFVPIGETRTAAELAPSQKDAMSHRGKAFRALAGAVRALVEAPAPSVFDVPHVPVLEATPNEGKSIEIEVDGQRWSRIPIRTHTVTEIDDAAEVAERYCRPLLRDGDIVIMSERVVAITQGRAYPIANIEPGRLARFLQRFVTRTPVGIGLGSPWTMELAIREVGKPRILAAAAAAAITKPFGVKGVFYRVAGSQARAIDGPCDNTLPPFNEYATLGPAKPNEAAARIAARVQAPVVIIDANDLGVNVLGRSPSAPSEAFCEAVFRDNPLGQSSQRTPIAIVRRA